MSIICIPFARQMSSLSQCASCNMFRQACAFQRLLEFGVQSSACLWRNVTALCGVICSCILTTLCALKTCVISQVIDWGMYFLY
jgi:hypothetical protein